MKTKIVILSIIILTCGYLFLRALPTIYKEKLKEESNNYEQEMKLIHGYPNEAIYYYYSDSFKPTSFTKPQDVQIVEGHYTIFIYNKQKNKNDFVNFDVGGVIEDNPGFMFSMYIIGLKNQPKYYVRRYSECLNDYNGKCIDICEFNEGSNLQIKYTHNPSTGEIIKQMEFDNGPIGFPNMCNPDWIPGMDI